MRSERVTVVGAGRMGLAIAQVIAAEGCSVKLVSRHKSTLNRAIEEIQSNLILLQKLKHLNGSVEEILSRIDLVTGISEPSFDCDFLFEAIPENPELKKSFLADIDPYLDDKTIIASTTSTINLRTFKGILTKPDRLLITHWLNPAFLIPLVEIALGEETSMEAAERMKSFLKEIGKLPILLKDSPGFILPRLQSAVFNEATRILEEGIASAEDIDTVTKVGLGFRQLVFGMLEFVDLGGLDILYYADQFLYSVLHQDQFKVPALLQEKMEKNEIGPRTGKGIYDYSGIDTRSLFENRYQGFVELLDFIESSKTLALEGGIKIRDKEASSDT